MRLFIATTSELPLAWATMAEPEIKDIKVGIHL